MKGWKSIFMFYGSRNSNVSSDQGLGKIANTTGFAINFLFC